MTEIEKKALALVSEVLGVRLSLFERSDSPIHEALCRAIEQHEAFRQKVSDAVEHCRACSDPEAWTRIKFELGRFIIPKPPVDPLVEVLDKLNVGNGWDDTEDYARRVYEALAKRGLKIVEDV